MEDFESYLEARNFRFSSWTEFLENENIDIWNNTGCENAEQGIQLLPRQDFSLYGIIPKMERRSFSSCKQCEHVFNPKDILLHKNCTLKVKPSHVSSHFKKKVKSKKKPPPVRPLFQTGLKESTTEIRPNSLFIVSGNKLPTVETNASVALAEPPQLVEEVGNIPLPAGLSLPILTDSPPPPPPPPEPAIVSSVEKAPKISSHTNSHSPSSSKSKKKKHTKSHREPETNKQSGLVQDLKGPSTRSIKYSNHNSEGNHLHRNKKTRNLESGYFHQNNPQEIPISVPIVYMPMSPVSSVTSLQIIQEGNIVCLDTPRQVRTSAVECPRQVYLSIPEHLNVVYKARPKPCSHPLYGAQKMGGAIVISKQKLNLQRKDILAAIYSKHKTNDILSSYKCSSLNNDIKHIHLTPDINGFMIHGEVPKSNEDLQNFVNDSKISSMNIK